MAKKVTIHTTDGESYELDIKPGEEAFYDDLPFTASNVLSTEIKG